LEKKARISALLSAGLSTIEIRIRISIKENVSLSDLPFKARTRKRESMKMELKDLPRSLIPRLFSTRAERKVVRLILISSGKHGTYSKIAY
jgi:hypothetical protein